MRQVRRGTFETNSSSTHSLTICTAEEFEKWKCGELLFNRWSDCFEKSVELSAQQKQSAKEHYNDIKERYWKDWEQLSAMKIKLSVVFNDCTGCGYDRVSNHMSGQYVVDTRNRLRELGLVDENTLYFVNHFSHNGHMTHAQLEGRFNPEGIEVAYDGLEVKL